jgi:hypothetical protein
MIKISNIKISCVFKLPYNWKYLLDCIVKKRSVVCKKRANIIIIQDLYVFCVFEKKDTTVHFNVTKIKTIADIFKFLFFFSCEYFSYDSKLLSLTIDNITASVNSLQNVNLHSMKKLCSNATFNPERFAGLFIKLSGGTVIIFRTGKVNIVGCKSISDVNEIWNQIRPILQKSVNM